MLYTVSLDENNYIQSIGHTKKDNTELDIEEIDLQYLNAYQLIDGIVVLNEDRKKELIQENEKIAKEEEILTLTDHLKQSDEDMLGFVEDLFSLKNPLTFISDMFTLMKNYASLVSARQEIRERIKELKNEINE